MQRVPDGDEHAVAARFDESPVEVQGFLDVAFGLAALFGPAHVLDASVEVIEHFLLEWSAELYRTHFECGPQLVGFAHLVEIGAAHASAAIPFRDDEARSLQLAQCFANGRLAHVEFACERELLELRARGITAVEDACDEYIAD